MLSLFKSKPKAAVQAEPIEQAEPVESIEAEPAESVRRMKQQNIKASEDCIIAFAAIAKALGRTKAELFEDMVAERLESLRRQGVELELA
jgi:hypothetical protein